MFTHGNKMTNRVKSLEAKVVALEDFVKLSMVKFRQALLLEMGNIWIDIWVKIVRGSSGGGGATPGAGKSSFSSGDNLDEYYMAVRELLRGAEHI